MTISFTPAFPWNALRKFNTRLKRIDTFDRRSPLQSARGRRSFSVTFQAGGRFRRYLKIPDIRPAALFLFFNTTDWNMHSAWQSLPFNPFSPARMRLTHLNRHITQF